MTIKQHGGVFGRNPTFNNVEVQGALNGTTIPSDKTLLVTTDIGSTVEAFDATILKSADIGSSVQAYDADTAKLDVAQTFTANQAFPFVRQRTTTGSMTAFAGSFGRIAANGNTKTLTITFDSATGTAGQMTCTVDTTFGGQFNNWNARGTKRIYTSGVAAGAKTSLATQTDDILSTGGIGGAGVVVVSAATASTSAITIEYTFDASSANTSQVDFIVIASVRFEATADKRDFTMSFS